MQVDGNHNLFERDAQLLGRAVNNAAIGLVRNQPIDVVRGRSGCLEAASITSVIMPTACLKTSRPSIRRWPTVPVVDGPPST